MQKALVKKNFPRIMDPRLRVGMLKLEFQVTKTGTPREGDMRSRLLERGLLWSLLLLSMVLRVSFYQIQTDDYTTFLHPWYDYIQAHGGFAALKDTFSDYNPAYLYLLAWATSIPIPPIVAIKMISTFFDVLLALFTYLILRLKYPHSSVPSIGAVVILFTPTIFLNSAAWGQCDVIYTTWCLGSLYFLLSKRPAWACLCFGIAISFKLQAIFFLPVLIVLLLTRKLPIRCLILIPVIYLALLAPAFFEGRDAWSLLTIYRGEANDRYPYLTMSAPNFYQWLATARLEDWKWAGILLATMMIALLSLLAVRSRKRITPSVTLKLTLVFALVLPFLLPEMHERYFYLADAVSIIYGFCFPRYFYLAVIEQLCSLLSYTPFLFHTQVVNLAYVACVVLFLIVITLADVVKTLYPHIYARVATPVVSSKDISPKPYDDTASPKTSSDMDASTLHDGISSKVSNDMDSSKDSDHATPAEVSDDMDSSTIPDSDGEEPYEGVSSKNDTRGKSTAPNGSRMMAFLLFLGNYCIQSWALGKQVRPFTDEGVYLYQAKLITQGYLPYKDFAMTSHVPFLMYLDALVLKLCNFDMLTYHRIYVVWVFLTIFPLFSTVLYFTRSRVASLFSCVLFSTFTEMVQWDAHFFAIRQASLPLFACFIYFFFVVKKEKLSQIFLALFSFCLITNFFISLAFVMMLFPHGCIKHRRSIGEWTKKYICTYWIFVLLTGTYFGLVLLIPGSIHSILLTQKGILAQRDLSPYVQTVKDMLPSNWPMFLFGALGIFFFLEDFLLLSLLSIFTFLISLFVNGSFYAHYITVIAVPFAIMGGIFLHKILVLVSLNERKMAVVRKMALIGILLFAFYQTVYSSLSQTIVFDTTPDFFQTVRVLEHCPEPLFTVQPIYALYAHKDLVMYYNTTDMRVFGVLGTNLSYEEYHDIISRSNTVLLESWANGMLPEAVKEEIGQNFSSIYSDGTESVYVRKIVAKAYLP